MIPHPDFRLITLECYRLNDRGNWELFHDFTSEDLGNDEVEFVFLYLGSMKILRF